MNVLIYSGPGTTAESVKHCLDTLRLHLSSYYAVIPISELVLLNEPWMRKTSMLVIPGGADLPYCRILNGEGNKKISKFVSNGGKFLGFCAGGYYASSRCEFEVGTSMEVSGSRELQFFPGISKGCAFKGFEYESQKGARICKLTTNTGQHVYNYYNGGGIFANASEHDVEILATYDEITDIEDEDRAAIIYRKYGKGDVILSGTHPEYPIKDDYERRIFMRELLRKLGLKVEESVEKGIPNITPMYIMSNQPLNFNFDNTINEHDTLVFNSQEHGQQILFPSYYPKIVSFNIEKYFNNLKSSTIGQVFGYSEVITSTNTILEKNPTFLKELPHGFTLTASTQIAGKGRGGNVWINPKGVLATSILFKITDSSKIVTLQYLCGLALIEAILNYGAEPGNGIGYEQLPIKLKWPNDIYILKPEYFNSFDEVVDFVNGEDEKWVKISGQLINSQYLNNTFYLIWGAGLNVSNEAPTTSLNLVLKKLNQLRLKNGLDELPSYEIEILLARIVNTVDKFFSVFIKSGLDPFLPLYYKRWFHSNQKVFVDGKKCIIKGITSDYGLLIAESDDKTLYLQPDGNSFDIFKELCGICRVSFDSTCPNCKYPGDDCSIVLGLNCTHNFHLHCILKWLEQDTSKGLCPMCRQIFTFKQVTSNTKEIQDLRNLIDGHKIIRERQQDDDEFD
ncbi:unnamed protein product [Candida verbasci]|uniref:Anaphase-promoting complex subunit 11 n=1 Tax=Candida verbasci TaxID=1227364 RepID=A0A9W4TRY5_9ASCO|nr:unnamed protein product [Candida verbasci]